MHNYHVYEHKPCKSCCMYIYSDACEYTDLLIPCINRTSGHGMIQIVPVAMIQQCNLKEPYSLYRIKDSITIVYKR